MWFHARFCVWELPWDSPLTWLVAFFGVDCGYYWFHRFAHGTSSPSTTAIPVIFLVVCRGQPLLGLTPGPPQL